MGANFFVRLFQVSLALTVFVAFSVFIMPPDANLTPAFTTARILLGITLYAVCFLLVLLVWSNLLVESKKEARPT